ncbi:hypothetical protein HZS_6839 [Henneguya salminicola]|nr:hypothetical protein HZS_6839 [Henneguya salminicola]
MYAKSYAVRTLPSNSLHFDQYLFSFKYNLKIPLNHIDILSRKSSYPSIEVLQIIHTSHD